MRFLKKEGYRERALSFTRAGHESQM